MKTIIVTGASEGIGVKLVQQLAEEKITVYAVARNAEKLRLLQKSYPDHIIPIIADLSTEIGINHASTLPPFCNSRVLALHESTSFWR